MPSNKSPETPAIHGAYSVVKESFRVAQKHPQIFLYPYIALIFTSVTYSLISATVIPSWYGRIFHAADYITPHRFAAIVGVVGFSTFYTALVAAYFTSAVSASVLAMMDERKVPLYYGVTKVFKHFWRIGAFALLSLLFFPIGLYLQRKKFIKEPLGVLGSSLTLHMAQVAPAALSTRKKFGNTILDSIDSLGKLWHEGLILKIGMYLTIFVVFVIPKLIQHQWFKSQTASDISWLISIELAASSYVTFKVINSIFTAVLYHQAKQKST